MTQLIEPDKYYQLIAFYLLARQSQKEVREYEERIARIIKKNGALEKISDAIYDPSSKGTKAEFDDIIFSNGVSIEWKTAENKFAKMEGDSENVGG
jgi:hypothetical protein